MTPRRVPPCGTNAHNPAGTLGSVHPEEMILVIEIVVEPPEIKSHAGGHPHLSIAVVPARGPGPDLLVRIGQTDVDEMTHVGEGADPTMAVLGEIVMEGGLRPVAGHHHHAVPVVGEGLSVGVAAADELSKYRKHHQTAVAPPTKSNEYERISESSGWWLHKGGQWRWHQDTNMYFNGEDNQYYHISLSTGRCRVIRDKDDPLFEEMQKCERERAKSLEEAKTSSRVDPEFVDWEEAQKLASSSGRKKSLEERSSMSENATSDVAKEDTNPSSPAGDSPARRATDGPRKDYKIGRVAKFDQTRGFGFIYRSYEDSPSPSQRHHFEDDEVLFVHRKGIAGSTLEKPLNLDPGAPVRYLVSSERESAVSSTKTRDQAVDVSMLSDPTDVDSVLPIHDPDHCSDPNDSKPAKLSSSLLSHGESWPGLKKTLQDRTIVGASLDAFGMLYGVFDGHGGSSVADILVKEMPRKLLFQFKAAQLQPSSPSVDIAAAITAAFQQVDKDILDSCERKPQLQPQGSTATIFIVNYSTPPRMIVASVGDSRAVLCRDGRAIVLTRDHDPEDPIERSRVEKAGGQIMMVQGVARVCTSKTKRVMQGLAMTRSIGDYYFKRPHALSIPDPDVQILPLDQKDCFVLLASDGIFEKTMTNDQAVALAAERLKAEGPEGAAKAVIRNAYSQGSEDNLSCICVQFDWHDAKSLDVNSGSSGVGTVFLHPGPPSPPLLMSFPEQPY
ncbi:hypothetical protein FOZ60_009817 [Perkinsus olseni]|uniref:PPM-type phosphatase domain-containing protein n=1 Tax=Perkinsus olseni TaxID=32597 RepID=A0A7J6NGT5_PEROL|nr:hypothetical protein FOZ60_009817 [Perkinsus olseni]